MHKAPAWSRITKVIPAAGMTAAAPVPSFPDQCSAIQAFHPILRSARARSSKCLALISSCLMVQGVWHLLLRQHVMSLLRVGERQVPEEVVNVSLKALADQWYFLGIFTILLTHYVVIPITPTNCLEGAWAWARQAGSLVWRCTALIYLLKIQVFICNHILLIQHILHILHNLIYIDYIHPLTGHSDRMIILKSAAYYALTDEELEEILSCDNNQFSRLMWLVCSGLPAVSGSLSCQLRPRRCSSMTFFIQQLLIQTCRLILAWFSRSNFRQVCWLYIWICHI